MTTVHINTGGGLNLRREVGRCWGICEVADAPLVRREPGSPYYGPDYSCTICGDSWAVDGDTAWIDRPFERGWRPKALARAVAQWEAACECPLDRDADLYVIPCEHSAVTR